MSADAVFPLGALFGFLFVLGRVAGVFVFVPLPGMKKGAEMARVVLALAFTLALYPRWPAVEMEEAALGTLAFAMVSEAALGITVGMVVAFLREAFLVGSQMIAMQAGFGYASMVNPATDANSSVLLVFAELTAGMLFFALGLEREVLRSLSASLEVWPPGSFAISRPMGETVAGLGTAMFSTGVRLAFPVIALLTMVDLALALLGRLQPKMQLLLLAFPAKMLAALLVLAWAAVLMPKLFRGCATHMLAALRGAAGL
jgi:flagellar biosynthesis protein FliR